MTIRIPDLDHRIEEKYLKLKEDKKLNRYLSEIILDYEFNLLGEIREGVISKDVSKDLIKRVQELENKFEELLEKGIVLNKDNIKLEEGLEGKDENEVVGYSKEAEDFLLNMMEI